MNYTLVVDFNLEVSGPNADLEHFLGKLDNCELYPYSWSALIPKPSPSQSNDLNFEWAQNDDEHAEVPLICKLTADQINTRANWEWSGFATENNFEDLKILSSLFPTLNFIIGFTDDEVESDLYHFKNGSLVDHKKYDHLHQSFLFQLPLIALDS